MARKPKTIKQHIIEALRKLSYFRNPARGEAMRNAKVGYGMYRCSACGKSFPPDFVQVDHTEPVIPVSGFTTWDDYIARLFCPADHLTVMCKPCHSDKSATENRQRRKHKKEATNA